MDCAYRYRLCAVYMFYLKVCHYMHEVKCPIFIRKMCHDAGMGAVCRSSIQ